LLGHCSKPKLGPVAASRLLLYEFPAEVAGLKALEPGWRVLAFAPRIDLYQHSHMTVPLGRRGVATVTWMRKDDTTEVQLVLPERMPVVVIVRGAEVHPEQVACHISFSC
jgi:hypothetical protein